MLDEEQKTRRLFGNDNTMGLFVSLYLILLAFFIVLNASARQNTERVASAIESVNNTFEQSGAAEHAEFEGQAFDYDTAENDPVLTRLNDIFSAEFDIEGRFSDTAGKVLQLEFPAEFLFERGSFRVRRNRHGFLKQVQETFDSELSNGHKELAFMFGIGRGTSDSIITRTQDSAVRRAGSLARYMREIGIESGTYSTGFAPVAETSILAVFRITPDRGPNLKPREKVGEDS